ncbi:hypothetical protein [Ralstonia pseudosolanacearum]|uniref:hypothetical protein n=1 Tax=Ralstonia pseudosolanacearum TaxID=1310165 RepID=UPI003CF948B9
MDAIEVLEAPRKEVSATFDDLWITPAVKLTYQLFRDHVPGAAFEGEPFMTTAAFMYEGRRILSCMCFYHTVTFFEHEEATHAAIFTIDEGGMVPMGEVGLPDPAYLEKLLKLTDVSFTDLHKETVEHLAWADALEGFI